LEDDGNGTLGEGWGQGGQAGEGLGAVDINFAEEAFFQDGVGLEDLATVEEEAGDLLLVAAAKGGVPVVQKDGGAVGDDLAGEGGGGDAGGIPGLSTEAAEHSQAGGFSGLSDGGIDVEVGGNGSSAGVAIGMKDPQSENDALVLGADQIAGNILFELIHDVFGRLELVGRDRVIGWGYRVIW
jgi:hypothetical protein